MSNFVTFPRLLAAGALTIVPLGAVATVTTAKTLDSTQLCQIDVSPVGGGMVKFDAIVHADKAVSGSYTFLVQKTGGGGGSTINQGGDFNVQPGLPSTLSSVSLGSKDAQYKATLNVTTGGKTISCTKQTGDI